MIDKPLCLHLLPETLAVCRLRPDCPMPDWAAQGSFYSITRTTDETSVVCPEWAVPLDARAERGWRTLRVEGPLDFSMTGVLACLTMPLAETDISVFALSTYDTDYLLIRDRDVPSAVAALRAAGHRVVTTVDS
ncbi:MAG: ACT domain-containing protein [Planctomycetes bacterium]|nr:ACT domain-containing protein [Planctomycetota bacterium]